MSEPRSASTDLVGRVVLGRFRVLRHLADGGMGAIYLARNEGAAGFVRPVVIKCILPGRIGDADLLAMFVREARIMATLRHPGIVSILDFADEDDMQLMVMEYVHGFHLGRWNRYVKNHGEQFPVELAIYVALHVLRALDYAHTLTGSDGKPLQIVHRDVTPSNVLVSVDGHVKLADFGIARTSQERTDVGASAIKGKFPYLAPEILQASEPSASSDVYSVGLILHELLVGKNEFREKDPAATVARVIGHLPTAVDQVRDVPPGLADVVAKALAKLPDSRYRSAAEMAEALSNVRTLSEDEGARVLRERVSADFREPEMAELFKLPELDSLESDWTTPSGQGMVPDPNLGLAEPAEPRASISHSTDSAKADSLTKVLPSSSGSFTAGVPVRAGEVPASEPGARPSPARSTPILIGLAIVAAAAVAIAALVLTRDKDAGGEQPVIVVSERVKSAMPPQPVHTASDAGAAAAPDAVQPKARPRKPKQPRKPLSTAERLNRVFAKHTSKLERCFSTHAVRVEGVPSLSLRIRAEVDGSVSSAEVLPPEISKTPLGACLVGVARSARLGKQAKAVTFRVPIKARARR